MLSSSGTGEGGVPAVSERIPGPGELLGKWTIKEFPGMEVEIRGDGTMSVDMNLPAKPGAKVYSTSSYKLEGDKITTIGTSGRVVGLDPALSKQMNSEMKRQLGRPQSGTIKWIDRDQFQIIPSVKGAPTVTYVRKR